MLIAGDVRRHAFRHDFLLKGAVLESGLLRDIGALFGCPPGGLAKGVDMGGLALSFVDKQINNGYAEGFSVPNKKREDHPDGSSQCSVAARVLMRTPWLRSSHVDRDNC